MRCYIIAEAGVNHNGSLKIAKIMVDKAKEAGADCIKFQTFIAENLVTKNATKAVFDTINVILIVAVAESTAKTRVNKALYHLNRWEKEGFKQEEFRYCPAIWDKNTSPTVNVLAATRSGKPFIISHIIGKGKVYTCLVPWFEAGNKPLADIALRLLDHVIKPLQPVIIDGPPLAWAGPLQLETGVLFSAARSARCSAPVCDSRASGGRPLCGLCDGSGRAAPAGSACATPRAQRPASRHAR